MGHLRSAVLRLSRLAGPVLATAIVVCVGGFGLQAARNWHRHGGHGAAFFHLHFHVGDHQHEHHGLEHGHHGHEHEQPTQQHPADDDHEHDSLTNKKKKRKAVLTVALALHDNAAAGPEVAPPEPSPDRTPIEGMDLPRPAERSSFINPRAPPV